MKHIQTIETRDLCQSAKNGGCKMHEYPIIIRFLS